MWETYYHGMETINSEFQFPWLSSEVEIFNPWFQNIYSTLAMSMISGAYNDV